MCCGRGNGQEATVTLFIVAVTIALGISGMCSLMEAMLLSLPPSHVAVLESRKPSLGRIWRRFKKNIEKPVAVILVLNTAAHTVGASVAGAKFEEIFGPTWLLAFSLVFTYVMLQFTEILPKTLGVRYNRALAEVAARPLDWLVRALAPVLAFVHFVNRPFERGEPEQQTHLDEITALAAAARVSKSIDARQERMIRAASLFSDLKARQIMTPRTDVVYLRADEPIDGILEVVQNSPYTRLPLCDGDIDNITGVIHVRDLLIQLRLVPGRIDIANIILADGRQLPPGDIPGSSVHVIGSGALDLRKVQRQVLFFPENMPVHKLLRRFQESRIHMGVVIDEYGSTAGIVTLEDVLEEIVGEIEDEFDRPRRPDIVEEEGGYRVAAKVHLHELRWLHLPEDVAAGVDTIGGAVAKALGRIPEVGDTVVLGGYEVRVLHADRRRAQEVFIKPGGEASEG